MKKKSKQLKQQKTLVKLILMQKTIKVKNDIDFYDYYNNSYHDKFYCFYLYLKLRFVN